MKKHFFVVAAVFISSQLLAQSDSAKYLLDGVVMTANKYPNKTSLTGKVMTVITKEQLEISGGKDLAQILTEQTGIYIGGANSNTGKDKSVYIRGARVDHTLITMDGIPVYDASGIGGNFDLRNIAIESIERIEILKGSQSTLYGSDAIAGVINIISKKAGVKPMNGSALLTYGINKNFRSGISFNGKKELFDYNFSYSLNKTDGINETESTSANADKDGYNQHALNVGIGIQVNNKFRIQPFFRFTKNNGDLDQGAFTDELDYTFSQKSIQTGLRNEISIGKSRLAILYSYNSINRTYIDDSIKSRNGYDTYSRGLYAGEEHFADFYSTVPLNNKLKLTTGVDFRSSQSDQEFFSVGFYGPYASKYSNDSLKQHQVGIYAALNFSNNKVWNVEIGNRLNIHSEYGSHDVFNINPSYLFNNKWKFFANFSSAYKTPSLYQLFSEYGNKKLKPESAITSEAGVEYFSFNHKFNGRIVYFKRDVKDVVFFYFNPNTYQSQYINQDQQHDSGLETEFSFLISKNISLKAFYSFVDGQITTKINSKDTTYFNLLRRPKHSAGISLNSQVTSRLQINSHLQYFGKRQDAYFDALSFQTVNTTLKSYVLWNLYADYRFLKNKVKLFADFRNITGSRFTEISGFSTLGFNASVGLKFNL